MLTLPLLRSVFVLKYQKWLNQSTRQSIFVISERVVGLNIENAINIASSDSSVNSNDGFDIYSSLLSLALFALPFVLTIMACIRLNSIVPLYGGATVEIGRA